MENLSPMLQQYLSMKQEVGQDTLLFFRLGDFYELFFEDAEIVSGELELILTSRAAGNNQKAPMCGVPHHAAHSYIQRLVSKGYKVAIAQQMEDPAEAKGLVKREVTKIITQGTNFDHDENEAAHLASITSDLFNFYVALYDITSNQMKTFQIEKDYSVLMTLLVQHQVKEILTGISVEQKWLQDNTDIVITTHNINQKKLLPMAEAQARLESYLAYTQKQKVNPRHQQDSLSAMSLDYVSLQNLELLEVARHNSKSHSLFSYLNRTKTSMGTRLLKEWIKYPLLNLSDIIERQQQVTYLVDEYLIHHQLSELLKESYDIDKIATKIEYRTSHAQDLVRLKKTLQTVEKVVDLLHGSPLISNLNIDQVVLIKDKIKNVLVDEPPMSISSEHTIKSGVDSELDELRSLLSDSNTWLLNYESQLRNETGIKNLKVGYSKQFGYYLEVSKGQLNLVKDEFGFIRRQTLTNAERFLTMELKAQEERILSASTEIESIETRLFNELNESLLSDVEMIRACGKMIAEIDCLSSLAFISKQPGFIKPEFTESRSIQLLEAVHPILEYSTQSHKIIANDFVLSEDQDVMILTGPNMGGKSTYMRQIAISIILAQMGCYVKAKKAVLPLFDAIYTRMGASDDIMSGHSTFMIEMIEANQAIQKATPISLILFDEIGRGTSTYDGMAIAGSILEYVATEIKATCIFSTHYHQLTALSEQYSNIVNYQVLVREKDQDITFLYKVEPGSANRSYGIHVAALAQLPNEIIQKANHRLQSIQDGSQDFSTNPVEVLKVRSRVEKQIDELEIEQLTPLQALQVLDELKRLNKRDQDE